MAKRHKQEQEAPAESKEKITWRGWSFSSRDRSTTVFKRHADSRLETQAVDFSLLSRKANGQLRAVLELWFELKMGFMGEPSEFQALVDEVKLSKRPFPLATATQFFSEISCGAPEVFDEAIEGTLSQVLFTTVFRTRRLLDSLDILARLPLEQSEAACREFAHLYSLTHDGTHAAARKIILERQKLGFHSVKPKTGTYAVNPDGVPMTFRTAAFFYPGELSIVEPVLESIVKSMRKLSSLLGDGFNELDARRVVIQLMENDFSTGLGLFAFDVDRVTQPGEVKVELHGRISNRKVYAVDTFSPQGELLSPFQHAVRVFRTTSGKEVHIGQVGRCPHPSNTHFHR